MADGRANLAPMVAHGDLATGAIADNVGGKNSSLSSIGKTVLDNIISGKFKRKVDLYVSTEPSRLPTQETRLFVQESDFYSLRDTYLRNGVLFEDIDFPANDTSLFYKKTRAHTFVQWMRPYELVSNPQLFAEGQSHFDVVQGKSGDNWLRGAVAKLALKDELFYRVVPPDQSFTENYAGIFHFQFWQYGRWVDVIVDDLLPTSNGELLYMHSNSKQEFWSALLEKAYAKLHGAYDSLTSIFESEALEDFTGGLTEFYDLREAPNNLLSTMMRAFEMGSLFGCSIEDDPIRWEARTSNGFVKKRAYIITGISVVDGPRGQTSILRIRNPWGKVRDWNGPWSMSSQEWNSIPESTRRDMGLNLAHDGEFWLSFEDFKCNFEKMEICHLGQDVMDEIYEMTGKPQPKSWSIKLRDGAWIRNCTAGGSCNSIDSDEFAMNPQYKMTLRRWDLEDKDMECTVVLAVLQKSRQKLRKKIGFTIFCITGHDVNGKLSRAFLESTQPCGRTAEITDARSNVGRFRLSPGTYVVVPSAYLSGMEAQFMMRAFTHYNIEFEELNSSSDLFE